jgi:hypothetical protein
MLILLVACASALAGGNSVTETRPVGAFSEVSVAEGLTAEVTVGPAVSVVVTGDAAVVARVRTVVKGSALHIDVAGDQPSWLGTPVVVKVTTPSLVALHADSGATATATGVAGAAFSATADSGGSVRAAGAADQVKVSVDSGGSVDAGGVSAKSATVTASSGGAATVQASDAVTGDASSGGAVHVQGKPATRRVSTSSGGSVD